MNWTSPAYAGGHCQVTHVDAGALEWLDVLGCRSLLDVGCGPGGQLKAALDRGWGAFGIDVDVALLGAPNLAIIDLADQPVIFHEKFDVVWSVEVAEHIPERFEENYITTLVENCREYLILTASDMPMSLHVNCKPRHYWIEALENNGMEYDEKLYQELLDHSTMEREFLRDTGMLFKRNSPWREGTVWAE